MISIQVEIKFQIPKPDMRLPSEVEDYLRLFWTRKVHPEVYTLTMDALNFKLEQEKGWKVFSCLKGFMLNFACK